MLPDNILIEDGWWSVAHQLTEYFMIGTFITPIKAKHDEILIAFCLSKIRHDNK